MLKTKKVPFMRGTQWESPSLCVSIVSIRDSGAHKNCPDFDLVPKRPWWNVWHEVILQINVIDPCQFSHLTMSRRALNSLHCSMASQWRETHMYWCNMISPFSDTTSLYIYKCDYLLTNLFHVIFTFKMLFSCMAYYVDWHKYIK